MSGENYRKSFQDTGDADSSVWSAGVVMGLIDDVPTCQVLVARMAWGFIENAGRRTLPTWNLLLLRLFVRACTRKVCHASRSGLDSSACSQ